MRLRVAYVCAYAHSCTTPDGSQARRSVLRSVAVRCSLLQFVQGDFGSSHGRGHLHQTQARAPARDPTAFAFGGRRRTCGSRARLRRLGGTGRSAADGALLAGPAGGRNQSLSETTQMRSPSATSEPDRLSLGRRNQDAVLRRGSLRRHVEADEVP